MSEVPLYRSTGTGDSGDQSRFARPPHEKCPLPGGGGAPPEIQGGEGNGGCKWMAAALAEIKVSSQGHNWKEPRKSGVVS